MRNQELSGMRGFKTAHPRQRSEERPFPNRGASLPSGLSYRGDLMREPCLQDALRRLASTYVETNIRVPKGSRKKTTGFHWLEDWDAHEDEDGKPTGMSMTLPRWLFDGIVEKGMVLTIHEDYFVLTGGIERWLYRVARKHAG